jgi:hypothetical protein
MLMTRNGAVLKLRRPAGRTAGSPAATRPSRPAAEAVIGLAFESANPDPLVAGHGRLAGVSNYLRGDDPGGHRLRQAPPVVYQEVDGARRQLRGRYVLHGDHRVGFAVAGYDTTVPLVIDPVIRYSTYLGGGGDDGSVGSGSWLDGKGNYFLPGFTNSTDFPVTPGAYQAANAGGYDVFLVKVALGKQRHRAPGSRRRRSRRREGARARGPA